MDNNIVMPPAETKINRVFLALRTCGSFTRFDAERQLSDHCLPSIISEIQKRYGAEVSRKFVTVPGFQGKPTQCCEYWVTSEEWIRLKRRKEEAPNSDQTKRGLQNVQD